MGGVERQQVGEYVKIGQIVNGDQLETVAGGMLTDRPDKTATDAAKTVDGNANLLAACHGTLSVHHRLSV